MKRLLSVIALIAMCIVALSCKRSAEGDIPDEPLAAPGYVGLEGGHFVLDGEVWFPKMLNYKCYLDSDGDSLIVIPAPWYTGGDIRSHFDTIASWGFNAVRLCLNYDYRDCDTAAMRRATRRAVLQADSAGLKVMLLIHEPLDKYWMEYTAGLLRALADVPALWAYDFMNEPLYFDTEPMRDKLEARDIVGQWRAMVRRNAPHQLFTVALAEPIEVFEWDPALLPVDFVEIHTYHPLRVQSEMWWYAHHCGKPWMVGETGLPADGDSVSYEAQMEFMFLTYRYAVIRGACGYGWWEFQDCRGNVNFEALHTGLRDSTGRAKPAARLFDSWLCLGTDLDQDMHYPVNYWNMLAYENVAVTGRVVDRKGNAVQGAVIRGWNDDWSVGVNTFGDTTGRFRLVSNDICTHFEISAPGWSKVKFDRALPYPDGMVLHDKEREYQQIPLMGWGWGEDMWILPFDDTSRYAAEGAVERDMGDIKLEKLL